MEMHEFINRICLDHKTNNDPRVKKPFVLFNQSDFKKYILYSNHWHIGNDDYVFYCEEPNDASLYSNIALSELNKSRLFFNNYFQPYIRSKGSMIPYLHENLSDYFDYLESVIKVIIFSFTTLEAFSNICIPDRHNFLDEKRKPISREKILRYNSLEFKFEYILKEVLKTPNPREELWWPKFSYLKTTRDEIIHSKTLDSNSRYAKYITENIFEAIQCHTEIINYYGLFIEKNYSHLPDEFPFDLGYDKFYLKWVSDEEYNKI